MCVMQLPLSTDRFGEEGLSGVEEVPLVPSVGPLVGGVEGNVLTACCRPALGAYAGVAGEMQEMHSAPPCENV